MPSVQPYADRARLAVVPLLHGAGVKRKVIQAMMGGTPVVTTPLGAEGLDLVQGEHALIAADAADLAAGITRLLTDDDLWRRLVAAGADTSRIATASTWWSGTSLRSSRWSWRSLQSGEAAHRGDDTRPPATARRASRRATAAAAPSGRPGSVLLVATRSEA